MVFAVVQTDLSISRNCSEIADVTFSFKEVSSVPESRNEIKANKVILALASEVFKTQFFGSIPAGTVVPVEDSNVEAFGVFIDILYNVKIQLKDLNFILLGDLFYLAEKYQVDSVKVAIVEDVKLRQIDIKDVLEILKVANSKSQLVQFADGLYKLCLKVILKSSDNIIKVFGMFDPEVEDESTSRLLHRLMYKAQFLKEGLEDTNEKLCRNCQHAPCLNGLAINHDNFVKNATVIWSRASYNTGVTRKTVRVEAGSIVFNYDSWGLECKFNPGDHPDPYLIYQCI